MARLASGLREWLRPDRFEEPGWPDPVEQGLGVGWAPNFGAVKKLLGI